MKRKTWAPTPEGEEWLKWRDFFVVGMSKQPRTAWSPVIQGRVGLGTATEEWP